MKNVLIASAVLAMLASPSLAFEVGQGFAFDSTVNAEYSVEARQFTTSYTGELNYEVTTSVTAYVDTTVDLQNIDFTGANLGVEYVPTTFDKLTVNAEAQFNEDLQYTDTVIYAELKF